MAHTENNRYIVQVFVGALSAQYEALSVEASKQTSSDEIVTCIADKLSLSDASGGAYELAEVVGDIGGGECKERRLGANESPVAVMLLWPNNTSGQYYRFYLREKISEEPWMENFSVDPQLIKDYFQRFLYQPKDREYPDLCQLPELNEQTLLDNLRARFAAGYIYTYVGSILIALNPFKFYPIYNPKYVKLYQNKRIGSSLPPHIFAVADAAYHCMLRERTNQCIVISGESGSGKTESTNFLLHHLTALSQKGSHGSGVEQTILSAGPVLEAFGNAKTAHNNNSSRFGKFIQVNYKENGMVHGAVVQKYLLEKSRICSQGRNERNYHVFYYLLAGASDQEREQLHLMSVDKYNYLSRTGCVVVPGVEEKYEFSRLKQSMEMVGFTMDKQQRLFAVLSAVLLLGNVEFQPMRKSYHHDEGVGVRNPEVVALISQLLRVKQETLLAALQAKRARASAETLVINYRLPEAIATRDAMAKCLYGALFDWIVMQVNHALLSKKDTLREHQGHSIGVLDIFGFEDFGPNNSFEQLCINYANEHLQYYFNQHVFKYEQEEYRREGIRWTDIGFSDNTGCLQLIEGKPGGLLCVLDDQCNFPWATNETLLQKFNSVHEENVFYEKPQRREPAFIVRHYAGRVKYQVTNMREKNLDLMRQDIVSVLKNSSLAFVRELVGVDPVAVFRWAIVRAFFRGYFAFHDAGRRHRNNRNDSAVRVPRASLHSPLDNVMSSRQHHRVGQNARVPASREGEWRRGVEGGAAGGRASKSRHERYPHGKRERDGDADVMQRASQIVMKNKSFRPRERSKKGLKNLQSVKTLACKTGAPSGKRKQPLTVAAQFQHSLHALMDTLNQANPFFIRCIKSNGDKVPNAFDEETVQRQLRYTGMLETVRIRQAGYNVRLTYDEFIQLYRILLPKGLLSSQADVRHFLATLNLDRDNYQLGATKIFMRESEQTKLDYRLHQQIMASIITIQRWFRAVLERRRFLVLRRACTLIQLYWRQWMRWRIAEREAAAVRLQAWWRGAAVRRPYLRLRGAVVALQAAARGFLLRRKLATLSHAPAPALADEHAVNSRQEIISRQEIDLQHKIDLRHKIDSRHEIDFRHEVDSRHEIEFRHEIDSRHETDSKPKDLAIGETAPPTIDQLKDIIDVHLNMLLEEESEARRLRSTQSLPLPAGSMAERMEKRRETTSLLDAAAARTYCKRKVTKTQNVAELTLRQTNASAASRGETETEGEGSGSGSGSGSSPEEAWPAAVQWSRCTPAAAVAAAAAAAATSRITADDLANELIWLRLDQTNLMHDNNKIKECEGGESAESVGSSVEEVGAAGRCGGGGGGGAASDWSPGGSWRLASASTSTSASAADTPSPRKVSVAAGTGVGGYGRSVSTTRLESGAGPLHSLPPVRRDPRHNHHHLHAGEVGGGGNGREEGAVPSPPVRSLRRSPRRPDHAHAHTLDDLSHRSKGEGGLVKVEPPNLLKRKSPTVSLVTGASAAAASAAAGEAAAALRRRNSDPAAVAAAPHAFIGISTNGLFKIAGHRFRKGTRFAKADSCVYCHEAVDAFVTQGQRCIDCKQLYHTKCIQNKGVFALPCASPAAPPAPAAPPGGRRKHRKQANSSAELAKTAAHSKFSLTGTSEFTDRTDKIISDATELQQMQDFITKKIYQMECAESKKQSEVDRVFKHALREFKDNLVATYSVVETRGSALKYKDLIGNFLHVMESVCAREGSTLSITMGVNAFRGFMDEFMNQHDGDKARTKRKKDKKRKAHEPIEHNGHTFILSMINIPTECEICKTFFMWPIERSLICQTCKLASHKKCYLKVSTECRKSNASRSGAAIVGAVGMGGQLGVLYRGKVFGVPLHELPTGDGNIPIVVDRLITTIEMTGLYTEGLYRKSGLSSKVRELKAVLDERGSEGVECLDKYAVHVRASVLKCFFRDMPEPLLTFDLYDHFILAAQLTHQQDRTSTLFALLKKLPKANFDLMERLIFHLTRVANRENHNRMGTNALAIVFAPCILRTNKEQVAQDSLHDIARQTACIETILEEKLRTMRATLADIATLDIACHTASHKLQELLAGGGAGGEGGVGEDGEVGARGGAARDPAGDEHELVLHLNVMEKERANLTSTLPALRRATSDDDLLSTDLDGESGSLDDLSQTPSGRSSAARPHKAALHRQLSSDDPIMV